MHNFIHKYLRNVIKNCVKHLNEINALNKLKIYNLPKQAVYVHNENQNAESSYIDFHGAWPQNEKTIFMKDMQILPDFLSAEEETKLLEEVEPYLKRLRYEFDHWDDAIHGYRETERKNWYPHNRLTIQRISNIAFNGEIMPFIHILDLDEKGVIKPHVDSTRYCGHTIAGVSLLSNSVMRLIRTDEKKYNQNKGSENLDDDSNYRAQPDTSSLVDKFYADILLPRRSLYIMCHSSRYNFTHEILSNDNSKFRDNKVVKTRRISIICRNEP